MQTIQKLWELRGANPRPRNKISQVSRESRENYTDPKKLPNHDYTARIQRKAGPRNEVKRKV